MQEDGLSGINLEKSSQISKRTITTSLDSNAEEGQTQSAEQNKIATNPGALSSRYQAHPEDSKTEAKQDIDINTLALTNPLYENRAHRLDLITNDLLGLATTIQNKEYNICDISKGGFSYAKEIVTHKPTSLIQLKKKVDQLMKTQYGKTIDSSIYFKNNKDAGRITSKGVVRNHFIFLGLKPDEIEREISSFLFSKSIRRNKDPKQFFKRFDALIEKTQQVISETHWNSDLCIALNSTLLNFVQEVGIKQDAITKLYDFYKNKPIYVKIGVDIPDTFVAEDIYVFSVSRGRKRAKQKKQPDDINQRFTLREFVLLVWKNCLAHYELDRTHRIPVSHDPELGAKLKEESARFKNHLERLGDRNLKQESSEGIESLLTEALYWLLIEHDATQADRITIGSIVKEKIFDTYLKNI